MGDASRRQVSVAMCAEESKKVDVGRSYLYECRWTVSSVCLYYWACVELFKGVSALS